MAEALILDSEALNALANPTGRGALALRARAIARIAHERGALVRVPSPVLAEVCRGGRLDAAVNHFLNREAVRVVELTGQIAQRAGSLLTIARMFRDLWISLQDLVVEGRHGDAFPLRELHEQRVVQRDAGTYGTR